MAKLIPTRIADTATESERVFLEELKSQLPDDAEIYHGMEFWIDAKRDPDGRAGQWRHAEEGEMDAVVFSPDLGLMVIEVKGGIVTYEQNRFFTQSSHGKREIHPIRQCHKALEFFQERIAQAVGSVPVRMSYAVATPYTTFEKPDIHGHEHEFIEGRHLGDLKKRLKEIAARFEQPKNLAASSAAVPRIRAILNPVFAVAPSLHTQLLTEEAEIYRLTAEQERGWVQFMGNESRALVSGPAGTGKTVLAMAHATMLARQGKRTLLTCFNKALAEQLSEKVASMELPVRRSLEVANVHALAHQLCVQSRCKNLGSSDPSVHFAHIANLPKGSIEGFDAIVVDEGQDIVEDAWLMLLSLLSDDQALTVFYDPQQELYDAGKGNSAFIERELSTGPGGIAVKRIELKENVRNAEPILHALLDRKIPYEHPKCTLQPGAEGVRVLPAGPNPLQTLTRAIIALATREGITPNRMVVLTLNEAASCTAGITALGSMPVVRSPRTTDPRALRIVSVGKFKGLEAEIVFVIDADKKREELRDAWEYVALSRAKGRVWVIQ